MSRIQPEHPAEEFLHLEGIVNRESSQRRAILGCVGCRWLSAAEAGEGEKFYGLEIVKCTQIKPGVAYPILKKLTEAGVMEREREDVNPNAEGRPARIFYSPADSELGQLFYNELHIPVECPLDQESGQNPQ